MKRNYQKLIALGFLFLINMQSTAQETSSFTITPELSKRISEKCYMNFTIYHVTKKEIEYHTADTTSTTKRYYSYALGRVEEFKSFKDVDNSFEQKMYKESIAELEKLKKVIAEETKNDTIKKRMSFMRDDTEVDVYQLSGEFIELPQKFILAFSDIDNRIIKNELSTDVRHNYTISMDVLTKSYPLIQKVGSDDYYFIMSDEFVSTIMNEQSTKQLLNIVNKLGYKEYQDGEDYYIKSKTSEIRLDANMYRLLKKNPNWITELDKDQTQIANLVKQTIPHSKTLEKYLSTYNIKRSRMPVAELNAWRTATKNAQQLHNQIYKLSEKYHGLLNSFTLLDKSNTLETFSDNLLASKGILGM